ncbi:MAG: hypothetical protein ACM34B_05145, partial [Nitrospira sp.]
MANSAQTRHSNTNWTPMQAYVLAAICLVVGIAVGFFIGGSKSPATQSTETQALNQAAIPSGMTSGPMAPGQLQAIPEQQSAEAVAAAAKP